MFFLCVSLSFTALEVECLSSDGQALLSLLSAADPYYKKSSPVLSSWNPSNPTPCSWQGITCSPQERVISLSIPDTFLNLSSLPSDLSSLSSLQLLNLSSTNISGSIPPSFGSLTQLRLLDLSSNSLSGPIPSELGKLTLLQFLFLNSNRLTGAIPQQLANLSSLQLGLLTNLTTFGAAATGLSGVIPPTFGNLINLQTLALYDTEVFGSIPSELGLCSELRNLYLHMNKLTGSIPPELGKLQKLTSMLLWGNSLSGSIPPELSNCSSLVVLDVSANDLSGEIPGDLGKLDVLEQLHLSDNALTGSIPWRLSNCTSLIALQLDKNQLSGPIPGQIGELKNLQSFFLWGNSVSGTIPPEFGNCTELYALDLSRNKLTGSIPEEVFGLKKLSKLLLLGNSLTGELPRSVARCQSLVRLRLGENQLSGQIPKEIGQLQNLVFLDLYMNHFSGGLPPEIGNISVLELLDVHNNYITGNIPSQLGALVNLEQLDLSRNSFTGEIPWSFGNFSYLNKLILNNNLLTGAIPKSIRNLQKITLLDLSFNSFSGPIPPEIGYLTSLTISLDLKANRFIGEIPETMSGLTQLQSLDLSSNLLYGRISVLSVLTSLTFLNVSCNNFSGPIPVTPFFHTLTMNSFVENPHLCQSLDGSTCSSRLMRRNGLKSAKTIALVAVILISVTMAVVATWIIVARNHKYVIEKSGMPSSSTEEDFSYPWTFIPFQKLNFSIENILNCLRDENVIGKGCSGVVYKAEMPNGELVAVKKLWRTKKDEEPIDSFAAEIQILGHIRHRNIVKLLGYCSNKSVKLLLYNFIPNGNLQQLLQNNRNLDWETRYKIAVGSAQGLAYLHHDCLPTILHRDVKCNNILLDSKYEAYLADFGLAKLMNSPNYQQAMSRVAGSYGYIAPGKCLLNFLITVFNQDCFPVIWFLTKYGYTVNITEKSDVYSYGVVLLEILSGRSAVEPQIGDGLHIVEWVKKKMGSFEPAVSVLDPKLQGLPDQLVQEMLQTLGIAMFCVNSSPAERPTMKEVVALLMEVKSPPEESGKTSQPLIKQSSNQS
ncbi:UNVERIFIED_CONTAM: putative LRR receptor-like serine/threonine-protein kinase [Sesamum angustifolium]|uniref:non-specific serine/threonine protein kinase n=1 Tax=Sesamum angustifolium TaxID=2727405 RepID=A0AAW2LU10_9LAMI